MARTKRGVVSRAKHNKVLKSVKGQRGRRKKYMILFKLIAHQPMVPMEKL